jgi:hypothetical protein
VKGRDGRRRRLRVVAGVIALLFGAWCAWLTAFGGVTIRTWGLVIRSNDVTRPFVVFLVAFGLFSALTGREKLVTGSRSVARQVWVPRRLALALSLAVVAIAAAYGSRVVGGADSYGYASEADLLLSGRVTGDLPALPAVPWPGDVHPFIPLGYIPVPGKPIMAPRYPLGFPLVLAALKAGFGQCAMFLAVPLFAGATVLLTFLIGRALTSEWTALAAALLVAVSPAFLYQSVQPMSDVPAAAVFAAACYGALRPGWRAAFLGGLAGALAILIRPNLAPFVGLLGLWYIYEARPLGRLDGTRLVRLAAFALTAAIGPVVIAAVNHHIFGSSVQTGYGDLSVFFSMTHVLGNARLYAWWTVQSQTPLPLVAFVTLLTPAAALWPMARDRAVVVLFGVIVVGIWVEYFFFITFGVWWFLRFLLPALPLMMIGAAQALWWLARRLPAAIVLTAGAAVCGYCVWFASDNFVFSLWSMQRAFYTVAQGVRRNADRRGVIYTNEESGSLRYYSGLVTFNYLDMQPADFDASVDFFAAHGAHPYLLAEDWEMDQFQASTSTRVSSALGRQPVFIYYGASVTRLYDLAPDGPPRTATDVARETLDGPRCPSPAAPRPLILDVR